jgi:serine/threonine protein kinase
LKCKYGDDIRVVHVDDSVTIMRLKRRLVQDFGFQVQLRYRDVDGDIILLQTQNDLAELVAGAVAGRAVSVLVQEAEPARASTTRGSEMRGSTRGSVGTVSTVATPKHSVQRRGPPNALSPLDNPPRSLRSPRRDDMGSSVAFSSFRTATTGGRERLDRIEPTPLGVGGWTSWKMVDDAGGPHDDERQWRWQRGGVIGQGAFGSVYQGLNLDTGELMAVKQLPTRDMNKSELGAIEHEISMMEVLEHENIVRYLGCEAGADNFSIFLEYVPGGSIRDLVGRFGALDETVVRVYTRQLLLGLEYLHRAGFAHRDIKGANILVANSGRVKVADFGASKRVSSKSVMLSTGIKGTPQWMAPEVIKEQQTDRGWKKADIWSVGCTVIEMATGKPPWSEFTNPLTCMFHISSEDVIPAFPPDSSRHQLDFLQRCLQRQPGKRPDVTSLLLHQFVAFAPMNVAADRLCLSMLDQRRPSTADAPSSRHSSRFGTSHSRHSSRRPEHPMSPGARNPSGRVPYGGYVYLPLYFTRIMLTI